MRVAYYTRTCYLDHSLSLVRAMSHRAEVHLLLELSPEGLVGGMFREEVLLESERRGVHSGEAALSRGYLAEVSAFLANLASFTLVVHHHRRAFALGSLRTGAAAAAHVRALRPDVLHVEQESSRALPLFLLTPNVPKLLAIHDVDPHLGEQAGRRDVVRRLAMSRASHTLLYSRYSQELFARTTLKTRSSVVPLGMKEVFRAWPGPELPERAPTLLFFGRIAPYKGLDVLYRALPHIARQVGGLRVVIAGRPSVNYPVPSPPALPASVEFVTHFGTVDNTTLHRLFQEASIVVLPYVEASQSGVVQTAYAFGKPVIASAIGGLAEVVYDGVTGRLVAPGADQPLVEAAVDLLLDADKRAAMRRAIYVLEEREFGWGPISQQLCEVYRLTAAAARPLVSGRAPSRLV
jgi:glycosyltransferase involved in cell wall biosynthesis